MSAKTPSPSTPSRARQPAVSAYSHHGGDEAKRLAKIEFDEKKAKTPQAWSADHLADIAMDVDRWCSWLPEDWTPAVKMTTGEILIKCMVGPPPDRKMFFHKADLEVYLGRQLGLDERGPKPLNLENIDPKHFLHRTESVPSTQYIKDRCTRLHGYSVENALKDFKYTHGEGAAGKMQQYSLGDLKYDLLRKNLALVPERPKKAAKPMPVPPTPVGGAPVTPAPQEAPVTPAPQRQPATPGRAPATPASRKPPATPRVPAPTTPAKRKAPLTPSRPAAAAPSTPAKKARTVAPATPLKHSPASSSSRASSSKSGSVEAEVFRSAYTPLRTKAATTMADEKAIYAVLGFGFALGIDSTMLKTLPDILRRTPTERGEFGQMALHEFEKAIAKVGHVTL